MMLPKCFSITWSQTLLVPLIYCYSCVLFWFLASHPQPYLLDSLLNKSRVHENDERDGMDVIKELPLEVILHRSLVIPISSQ